MMRISFWLVMVAGVLRAGAYDELTVLSDEFDSEAGLSRWERIFETEGWGNDALESLRVSPEGRLVMRPHTSSWYAEWRGELLYKRVSGDFVITTEVEPRSRDLSGAPNSLYSLAGIMVRAPRGMTSPEQWTPGGQNYMFLSLGAADSPGNYQFEVKTTVNSVSTLNIEPGVSRAVIQVVRVGPHFLMLRRNEGGNWVVHRRYYRPDMPTTIQAGLTVYTDWTRCEAVGYEFHNTHVLTNGTALPWGGVLAGCNPDLNASFEYVRFSRPNLPPGPALDWSNPNAVSATEILEHFGEAANIPGGAGVPPTMRWSAGEAGDVELELEVQPERSYRLQRSEDFEGWETERSFVAESDRVRVTVESNGDKVFYRVSSP